MQVGKVSAVAMLLLITAATGASAQRGAPDPERDAVRQLILSFAQNVQSGNLAALDSMFPARGVHILTDTATVHGLSEYRDRFLKPELARFTDLKFEHASVEAVVRGTVAWVAFRQNLSGNTATGPVQQSGRGTAVLEKRDGKWIIVHLHVSR
ncbi:MAG: nuclear transport factor 2 family protein [Gemmatimonadota bacterium]